MINSKIKNLIEKSNLLLEILDSRFPKDSRIPSLERYIIKNKKKLILVLNKSDLVDESFSEFVREIFEKEYPTVYVSSKTRKGLRKLRKVIKDNCENIDKVYIGVFGYPNTGKSSLINALVGRRKASVAPIPGWTKGLQIIKLSKRFYLIDSPGIVLPKDKNLLAILGGIRPEKLENPEISVKFLLEKIGKTPFEEKYGVSFNDLDELFKKLSEKFNIKEKDYIRKVSIRVLYDWINGDLKGYWF